MNLPSGENAGPTSTMFGCQRFFRLAGAFACFPGDVTFAFGKITLCTGITAGVPGSIPSCCRMGISVFPNLSNAACDVQTSNTIRLSLGPKHAWYERPDGLPAPAFFNSLMHSSYFAAD